jgi:hypothetical protein
MPFNPFRKRGLSCWATALAGAGLVASSFVPSLAIASSHREAPLIAGDPQADNTDVYAFVSPDNPSTVTLVANFIPFQDPQGGPNFYQFSPDVLYEIHVSNSGQARSDITYQFRFKTTVMDPNTPLYNAGPVNSLTDPNLNVRQSYSVTRVDANGATVIADNVPVPPDNVGAKSLPNYDAVATAAITTTSNGSKVFAGQRADSFFIDVGSVFDLVNVKPKGQAINDLTGKNVKTIALQVPKNQLTADGSAATDPSNSNSIIGVYSTTSRPTTSIVAPPSQFPGAETGGNMVQVSRLGFPLVNEVFVPLKLKDAFNASKPSGDGAFLPLVTDPIPANLEKAVLGINIPPAPRDDLVAVVLTGLPGINKPSNGQPSEMLRLNMAIPRSANPNRLGLLGGDKDGFPNGRRLEDDITDIELQAACGLTYPLLHADFKPDPKCTGLGDNVDGPAKPFTGSFPFLAAPYPGDPQAKVVPQ